MSTSNPQEPIMPKFPQRQVQSMELLDIDDLIPDEVKTIIEAKKEKEEVEEAKPAPKRQAKVQQAAPTQQEPEEEETTTSADFTIEEEKIDDIDMDLSSEAVDKLLDGDPDAIIKKVEENAPENQKPFWHEDPDYQKLSQSMRFTGVKAEELDKIITKVKDKAIVESATLKQGLERQTQELLREKELSNREMSRLKQIEREALFENSEETRKKYTLPKIDAAQKIRDILEVEGGNVSVRDILLTPTREKLGEVLKSATLDDNTFNQLVNLWRNYRETDIQYTAAKQRAQTELGDLLKTKINPEVAQAIKTTALLEIIESNKKYESIKATALGTDEPDEEAQRIIGAASANFDNYMKALENPSDVVHNQKWLIGLNKFLLEAEYNRTEARKYPEVIRERDMLKDTLKKIALKYRALTKSAKGITGKRGTPLVQTNGHKSSQDTKEKQALYEKFTKGEADLDELIPNLF